MKLSKKQFFIFFLIFITVCLILFFVFKKETTITPVEEAPVREYTIPARPQTFDEGADGFITTVRKARIAISNFDIEGAQFYTKEARILWKDVIDEFSQNPPIDYPSRDEWIEKLENIYVSISNAYTLIENNDIEEAIKELDNSREKIENTIGDKTIDSSEHKLFGLLKEVEKVSNADTYNELRDLLPGLKLSFMEAKSIANIEKYESAYIQFEELLADIDSSTENSYKKYQDELMPEFIKIYKLY